MWNHVGAIPCMAIRYVSCTLLSDSSLSQHSCTSYLPSAFSYRYTPSCFLGCDHNKGHVMFDKYLYNLAIHSLGQNCRRVICMEKSLSTRSDPPNHIPPLLRRSMSSWAHFLQGRWILQSFYIYLGLDSFFLASRRTTDSSNQCTGVMNDIVGNLEQRFPPHWGINHYAKWGNRFRNIVWRNQ